MTASPAPSVEPAVELVASHVSKSFTPLASAQPFLALDDIDLEIPQGRFVVLIGSSGCGKSTLLRILSGLETPSQGEVYHAGKPVKAPSNSRGFVFQADAVFPWLTVRKNVEFGLKSRGIGRRERMEISRRWCEAVGLSDFMGSFPKELSGGMRKRVDLARVYANDPRVLFMDEPFGALDAQTKERMQTDLLRTWERDRKTVVFVTHDVDEAVFLADEVVIMSSRPGRIARRVPIDLARPRTEETRISDEFAAARRHLREVMRELSTNRATGPAPDAPEQ